MLYQQKSSEVNDLQLLTLNYNPQSIQCCLIPIDFKGRLSAVSTFQDQTEAFVGAKLGFYRGGKKAENILPLLSCYYQFHNSSNLTTPAPPPPKEKNQTHKTRTNHPTSATEYRNCAKMIDEELATWYKRQPEITSSS